MPLLIIALAGPPVLILLIAGLLLFKTKSKKTAILIFYGYALQVLLALPAGIYQTLMHDNFSNSPWIERFLIPLLGDTFNAGGYTIMFLFEHTVEQLEWLVGHRTWTVISNMPYYVFLLAIQASVLAFLFAIRYKKRGSLKDPIIIALGILFLINSLASVNWTWWGT